MSCVPNALQKVRRGAAAAAAAPFKEDEKFQMDFARGPRRERMRQREGDAPHGERSDRRGSDDGGPIYDFKTMINLSTKNMKPHA